MNSLKQRAEIVRLKLKNFLQYSDRELEFPDSGMVLLKGISGAGKSTIMKAIDYAINGTPVKKSWSGGIPSVILEWPSLKLIISRSGTQSNALTATVNGIEYKDDQAQAEIYKILCGSKDKFNVSSYIKQRMKGALINLGPAEQLRLIQSLAFGDEDPEIIKQKISSILKLKQDRLAKENSLLREMNTTADALRNRLTQHAASIIEPSAPYSQSDMADIPKQLSDAINAKNSASDQVHKITKELSNPLYSIISGLSQSRDILSNRLKAVQEAISEIDPKKQALEAQIPQPLDFDDKKLDAKIKYLDFKAKAADLVAEATVTFTKYNKTTPLGAFLTKEREELDGFLKQKETELATARAEHKTISNSPDYQECPSCSVALTIKGGKIHKHDGVQNKDTLLNELNITINKLSEESGAIALALAKVKEFELKVNVVKASMGSDPAPEIKTRAEIEEKYKQYQEFTKTKSEIQSKIGALELNKISLIAEQTNISKQIQDLEEKEKSASFLTPKAELEQKVQELMNIIEDNNKKIADFHEKAIKINEYEKAVARIASAKAVLEEIQAQYNSASNKVGQQEKLIEAVAAEVGAWTRMRELSDMAATQAVEDTISDINNNAQSYISKLFPDDGTVVRILNTTKNQKGDEKAKLSLEIIHKGFEAGKNDEELSGGEQDRIALSFQLAMSDLYSSPILMVDEGFVGADVEKTLHYGLQVLKDYSTDKIVFVIQHGAPEEFFDEIVNI